MTIDGKSYNRNYLDHEQMLQGADIRFVMSDTPNTKRGTGKNDVPYSFSSAK